MSGVNLSKLIFVLVTALIVSSCAKNESANDPQVNEPKGSREFKIQNAKSAFKVSLFGVYMGTPDYEEVWSLIERANSRGLIDSLTEDGTLFEGGVAHCIEVEDALVRAELLEDLKIAPTSLEESHYSIESVDSCSQ